MLNGDIAQIVLSVIMIVMTFILWRIVSTRLSDENAAYIKKWVRYAVIAYEQIFSGSNLGHIKRTAVIEFIKNKGLKITKDELEVLIEKFV
jgi:hypothetical protein